MKLWAIVSYCIAISTLCHSFINADKGKDVSGHNKCILASVDTSHGLANEIIKLHSLVRSTRHLDQLYFGFLVSSYADVPVMTRAIDNCQLNINFRIEVMKGFPHFMIDIMKRDKGKKTPKSWYHPGVFGNFLLPDAFPECNYFVYLDNDMFMNIDIVSEVIDKVRLTKKNSITGQLVSTHIGFMFETCEQSSRIRNGQFNNTHPFVISQNLQSINRYKYINNGIWIVNATMWRQKRVTEALWDAIKLAQNEPIFVRNGKINRRPDDQHINFLVQGSEATHLPSHLNIRKNCERMAQSFRGQGIIHLAGGKKVCSAPFPKRPMALMTSIVHSLSQKCNIESHLLRDCESTLKALKKFDVSFKDRGIGNFSFPPEGPFTFLETLHPDTYHDTKRLASTPNQEHDAML